jgi:hypothetical protein
MRPAAATFEARIYRIGQLRCVDVPERVSNRLGVASRIPVQVRIGEHEGQTNLVRTREGGHRLYLAAALRRHPPLDSGDRIRIHVRPDPRGAEPELPADLVAALRRVPGCMAALRSRSPADRRQLVRWIEQPKSAAAREHRIERALKMIQRGPPKRPARGRR